MTIYFRFYLCKNKLMKVFIGIEIWFGFSLIDIKKTFRNETSQAAQAHYLLVRASEVIWSEFTRIISVLSDAK